jgi:nucleoside-diphosphate-sugar epimerase
MPTDPQPARTALVCGAGGFVGGHLVERLKAEGFWVRGVDCKLPEFRPTAADDFMVVDLREPADCHRVLADRSFDQVYQLAADMGGMEFIHSAECDILKNSVRININMVDAAAQAGVDRYFFASSVCVYRDMQADEPELTEDDAYPAFPDNEYGWEKLYSERVLLAHARHTPMKARIGRFENTFGPYGTWQGGREKAPAAICRKVAAAPDGGEIEVFGDGSAVRCFTYIDDLVDGIRLLVESDVSEPANIGTSEYVTVDELVDTVFRVSGKRLGIKHIAGPVGVASRNFSKARMEKLGYQASHTLEDGIRKTYPWIAEQVAQSVSHD